MDISAAVAWNNRRASHTPRAQELLRLLSLLEVEHNMFISAAHVAGAENTVADAGSRVWTSPRHRELFANLVLGWTQITLPPRSRDLSVAWQHLSAPTRWRRRRSATIPAPGDRGRLGAAT
jgi:hypothetical protein